MMKMLSVTNLGLCCILATAVLCGSPRFIHFITVDSEGWGSMMFRLLVGPPIIVVGMLLLAISAVLYRKRSRTLDLVSVYISGIIVGVTILAWALVEPLRQWIIFGK